MPPLAISLGDTLWNRTGSWRYQRPLYRHGLPPCNSACPAGEEVQAYVQLIAQGQYPEALARIRRDNPLPGVCGRVCYHPCETACNRAAFDEAIAIQALERFASEQPPPLERPAERRRESVAIVGAGPAGLSCAYHLARQGYPVTVFDALPQPGGMLRIGIPPYRLPRSVLDREIEAIASLGVAFRTGIRVGSDVGLEELRERFDAVFLATGAHRSRRLSIPGEDAEGVVSGIALLADLAAGRLRRMPRRVVVIGGGNTAIDVARSARRLGASPIIVYRRSASEMPAIREEVEEAAKEGVRFEFLAAPLRVLVEGRRAVGLECVHMQLGEPDESGRPRPLPVAGASFCLEADLIVRAIGEDPDLDFLPDPLRQQGQIGVDEVGATAIRGIFAGGDAATGRGRVADAIGSGKRAALSIHRYLSGTDDASEQPLPVVRVDDLNLDYFQPASRIALPRLRMKEALQGFAEVNLGLDAMQAVTEAARCFSCGVCTYCDNCWVFCPDAAIARTPDGYLIDYDHCKGCGICVHECPRGAMALMEESEWRR